MSTFKTVIENEDGLKIKIDLTEGTDRLFDPGVEDTNFEKAIVDCALKNYINGAVGIEVLVRPIFVQQLSGAV